MSATAATVGLILGLLIGAPMGFAYAVARRSRADRDKARELVKQLEREARGATGSTMAWVGVGVVVVVIAFACMFGAVGRNRSGSGACAPASRRPVAGAPASHPPAGGSPASRRPAAGAPGVLQSAARRLAVAQVSPTACDR